TYHLFHSTATSVIYTRSLHDALPIMITPMSFKKMDTIMATIPVIIEESDTYFDRESVIKNEHKIMINSSGLTPKIMPPDVATAFPPLKRAKSGYVCPKTAKTPIARRYTSAPNRSGHKVDNVPYTLSASTTILSSLPPM